MLNLRPLSESQDPLSPHSFSPAEELPVELLDLILTHVKTNDVATLQACALVSQTWSSFSRPHLFSDLHVVRRDEFYSLAEHLAACPEIAGVVCNLKLEGVPERQHGNSGLDRLPLLKASLLFERILPLLPRLRELSLVRVSLPDLPGTSPRSSLPFRLERLTIEDCRESEGWLWTPFYGMLSSRSATTFLHLVSANAVDLSGLRLCATRSYARNLTRDQPPPVPIRDLKLRWAQRHARDDDAPTTLYSDLERTIALSTLRSLTLMSPSVASAACLPSLGAIIRGAANSLVHLDLGLMLGPRLNPHEDGLGEHHLSSV